MTNPFETLSHQLNRIESMLVELKLRTEKDMHEPNSGDIDNGIALAMSVTGLKKKSIYNLVNKRQIPHYKKGKLLYFDEEELRAWIKSGKRLTKDEARTGY